jgi:hypothetical protein
MLVTQAPGRQDASVCIANTVEPLQQVHDREHGRWAWLLSSRFVVGDQLVLERSSKSSSRMDHRKT